MSGEEGPDEAAYEPVGDLKSESALAEPGGIASGSSDGMSNMFTYTSLHAPPSGAHP